MRKSWNLVIFDLDGTLLNTIEDITDSLNMALFDLGFHTFDIESVKRFVGSGVDVLIDRCLNSLNVNCKDEYFKLLLDKYQSYYRFNQRNKTRKYKGIDEVISYLKKNGIKCAVYSNKPHDDVLNIINYYFGNDTFDYVLGKKKENRIKPEIDGIVEIKKALSVKDNIMYVGDSNVDILTANNGKCFPVICNYGYGINLSGAKKYIDSPLDLISFIDKTCDLNKVLLLNKPALISSNSVINKVKYILKEQGYNVSKIGHAGTLDPNATGLLVVLLNDGTKLSDYLLLNDKTYVTRILIGESYDTYDIWGNILDKRIMNKDDLLFIKDKINSCLSELKGRITQVPPIYSSIKTNGKKLYEYARANEELDLNIFERNISIRRLDLISDITLDEGKIYFDLLCDVSKGTYIRSIASDIGKILRYPSSMCKLERVRSGKYEVRDSYSLEDIESGNFSLINLLDCLDDYKIIELDDNTYFDAINGKEMPLDTDEDLVVMSFKGKLVSIYERKSKGLYKAKRVWQ